MFLPIPLPGPSFTLPQKTTYAHTRTSRTGHLGTPRAWSATHGGREGRKPRIGKGGDHALSDPRPARALARRHRSGRRDPRPCLARCARWDPVRGHGSVGMGAEPTTLLRHLEGSTG